MRAVLPQQLQHSNIIQARTSIDQVIHATLTHTISSSNKSKQHPSERHHTAATFVQASRSIQETFLLRGNPSSNLMQHCSLSGNIRHLNQLRYRAPTNIQAISVHVTFCPGKLSQQHHIHPSDRHRGDINPCNIFIQAALERVSSRWKLWTCGKTHLPNPNPSSHQSNATVRVL